MPIPKLTEEFMKEKLEQLEHKSQTDLRHDNLNRWKMYNGSIRDIVRETIIKEFKKPETMNELIARLIPINIPQKIVNKLANVYNEAPLRVVKDRSESDQELVNDLEKGMMLNSRQKENNRFFKLFKTNLQELVVSETGVPSARNLPRHTYEVWSHSAVTPEIPDTFMKFTNFAKEKDKQRRVWWTDNEHKITDGAGRILTNEMTAMGNPKGINPYGKAPFVYTNEETFSVNPLPDDDLLRMGVVVPLLLSDLAFAVKYLSWAVVYTVGAGEGDVPFSPSSVIALEFGPNGERPEINTVSPQVDINGVLGFVDHIVKMLLVTKNLSISGVGGTMDAGNAQSGVAKALDSAESQEDKKDQQSYFQKAEQDFWDLMSKHMMPTWRRQGKLSKEFNREFSSAFEINIIFREPKIIISEREMILLEKLKEDNGYTTRFRSLQRINPDLDEESLQALQKEIDEQVESDIEKNRNRYSQNQDDSDGKDKDGENKDDSN